MQKMQVPIRRKIRNSFQHSLKHPQEVYPIKQFNSSMQSHIYDRNHDFNKDAKHNLTAKK